jgi:hypothetical protein
VSSSGNIDTGGGNFPEFGWKGSGDNHRKALADQRKARMKAAKITGVVKTPPVETDQEK